MNSADSPAVPEPPAGTPAGAGTGVGSLPGTDEAAAVRLVFNELGGPPGVPFLPELPARGVGADLVGRSAALLVDLYAEVQPSGWRIADRPGRDHGRAISHLSRDLDLLEEYSQGYSGDLKVQAAGPWTLAAALELPYGDKLLKDPGAVRDLAGSLAEGLAGHVAAVRRRVPGASVILQLDEPSLPGVLRGSVPTASGFGKLAAVEEPLVRETLREVIETVGAPVIVHCCAPRVPFGLLRATGARGVSFDFGLLEAAGGAADEELGEAIEAGTVLYAGAVPSADPAGTGPGVRAVLDAVLGLGRLGFPPARLAQSLAITPSCGLAGASPAWAARALRLCRQVAEALREAE